MWDATEMGWSEGPGEVGMRHREPAVTHCTDLQK